MKKTLPMLAIVLLLVGCGQTMIQGNNNASDDVKLEVKDETYIGADFSSGIYCYQLSQTFNDSPNTIESWVRLGKLANNENGGVIFGNYEYYNYNGVKVEVNNDRQIMINWNQGQAIALFDEYKLATDEWTHICVVRDVNKGAFNLFVNGVLTQSINAYVGTDAISTYKFIIGSDWSNWRVPKNPFKGEIGQVTVYSSSLDSRAIYKDYIYGDKINGLTREKLLFNGELSFNAKNVIDTSKYANDAVVKSIDYLYDGEIFEAKDYSLAIIPDPQLMSHWRQGNLPSISQYIIEKDMDHNVALTLCVGDNADGVNSSYPEYDMDYQLKAIKKEYDKLADAGIRWITTPGNHDYDDNATKTRNLAYYNKYFSAAEISSFDYYGGFYGRNQTQNAYYMFEESGINYLVVSLEFGADDNVLNWANEVVEDYPDHRVIVYTHAYIGGDGEVIKKNGTHSPVTYGFAKYVQVNSPEEIFDKFISRHKNIFMVFSGHVPSDDILMREDTGDYGNTILSFLIDTQGVLSAGHDSFISMIQFDELNQTISVNLETATNRKLYNIQNQFTYSFEGNTDILSSIYYDEDGNLRDEYL